MKLTTFAGKPLVVNFFTAQSCDWAGAVLAKLQRDYAGRDLQIVGIDLYDPDSAIQSCGRKHDARYPMLKGDRPTQTAWIGGTAGWATFFITPDGRMLKKIDESVEDGMEAAVFPKLAEYLTRR